MMKALKIYLFSLIIGLGSLYGQSNNYLSFGVDDGLIQSQVENICQDHQGRLWIGTIGGLTIYDGVHFKSFTTKEGLSEDWISAIFMDSKNKIWMGHWGAGITIYDPEKDAFEIINIEESLKYRKIIKFIEYATDDYFILTEGAGLFRYKEGKITPYANIPSYDIKEAYYDKENGNIYCATGEGIQIINLNHVINNRISAILYNSYKGLPTNEFTSVTKALNNEIWFGTKTHGILRFMGDKDLAHYEQLKSLEGQYTILDKNGGLNSNEIKSLLGTSQNQVWIGTENNGINTFVCDPQYLKLDGIKDGKIKIFGNSFELKYYHANTLFEDREQNVWIGTEIGLKKYLGELFTIYDEKNNLKNNLIWSTFTDSKDNLWVGSSEGLSRLTFPKENGKKSYLRPSIKHFNTSNGLSENLVISITEDDKGNIWAGTENKGVNRIDANGKITIINASKGLSDNTVYSVEKDKDGHVWLGTKNGLNQIDINNLKVKNFSTSDGIGGSKVYKIYTDQHGKVWFGILGGDLSVYHNNEFKKYGAKEGFHQKFVVNMTEDDEGNMWFGTYQGGLFKFDGKTFESVGKEEGMLTDFPHFLIADKDNNIWIGHNNGIQKYNDKEKRFYNYGKKNGFNRLETNENAVTIDKDQNIWFGTIRGLVKFSPLKEKINNVEPLTKIDALKIELKDAEFPKDATYAHNENNLTLEVLGVSLTNPQEVTYSYRLIGLNEAWSPKQKDRNFDFSGLQPGDYTFEVKAFNNSDIVNKEPIVYSFTISPPWWQTWWARIGFLAILAVSIVSYIKIREKKLRERQAYLEEQVALRTEELRKEKEIVEEQNVEIEKKNKHITDSITYAQRIQGAVLPPADLIKSALPESFVYFNPRDIVSGDFYWLSEHDGKVIYAAADCTGHGVPGAFMSLVGHNLLDKIVNEYHIYKPAELLDKLSTEIVKVLRQDSDNSIKDGMDIAVCSIDYKNMKLEFAGAYNPLFLVRNGELTEFDGDRIPIGKSYTGEIEHYVNHEYDLKKGDCLYTFSDGYVDQKGGKTGKKLMFKRFRKLILEIAEKPIKDQEPRVQQAMEKWMGDYPQYDDMIIFGVRI